MGPPLPARPSPAPEPAGRPVPCVASLHVCTRITSTAPGCKHGLAPCSCLLMQTSAALLQAVAKAYTQGLSSQAADHSSGLTADTLTAGDVERDFWLAFDLLRSPKDHAEFTLVRDWVAAQARAVKWPSQVA